MRLVKRGLAILAVSLLVLLCVLVVNTLRFVPADDARPAGELAQIALPDAGEAAQRLAQAIRMPTVSNATEKDSYEALLRWLKQTYPAAHRAMNLEVVAGLTPLYRWTGRDASLAPVLLAAHYDVVPADASSLDRWTYPPFDGVVADGFVWGRGALDNKGTIVAMFEALEALADTGFQPQRTVYISLGHDEETGGEEGARAVADVLQSRGVRAAWSLDEGSFVLDGIINGIERPVASINVAQKGFLTLTLTAHGQGGHSSMPPRETAVGVLAMAIDKLQKAPVPGGLRDVSAQFFDELARHFPFGQRLLFANRWLFGPLIERVLSATPATNAVLRTTTAPTMLQGSEAANVLPTQAIATVNFRLHPRDTIDGVVAYVRETINDERVAVQAFEPDMTEASAVSDSRAVGYQQIRSATQAAFGDVIFVAGLTVAGTDSTHYVRIAQDSYRFNPFLFNRSDLTRMHGIDERLSVENLARGMLFYQRLLREQ